MKKCSILLIFLIIHITNIKTSSLIDRLEAIHAQNPNIFQVKNKLGQTLLMLAIQQQNIPLIDKLLEKYSNQININEQDNNGDTALFYVFKQSLANKQDLIDNKDLIKILHKLIAKNADINIQNKLGKTLLHKSLEYKDYDFFRFLIAHNAKSDIKDKNNRTALHIFAQYPFTSDNANLTSLINTFILEALLKNGAKINEQDHLGLTPLHLYLMPTDKKTITIEFIKELIKHDADPNIQDNFKDTPLHIAILFHEPQEPLSTDIIKTLIPITNLNLKNKSDQKPFDMAKAFLKQDLLPLFITLKTLHQNLLKPKSSPWYFFH